MSAKSSRLVLFAGAFAYFASVLQRSSMGSATLAAGDRFHIGAATLSTLGVSQLAVYAAMQIPVGMLLERFGSKRLLIFGASFTAAGNLLVAFSTVFFIAVLGRMAVGFGDAFIFVSMIKLINNWVVGPRATRLTQVLSNVGQLGQIASAFPFAFLLQTEGWTTAFLAATTFSLVAIALVAYLVSDSPETFQKVSPAEIRLLPQLRENLGDPVTRKAFWAHFSLQSSGSVFILFWGVPFLARGEGLTRNQASWLLTAFVCIGFVIGPLLANFCAKHPGLRYIIVLSIWSLIVGAWLIVILTPGTNPVWQLVLLVLAMGTGGPASMVAFDYSRVGIPLRRLGSSNGIINSGGFVATFSMLFLIGFALDALHQCGLGSSTDQYSLSGFKLAFCVQFIVLSFGLTMFMVERRKTQQLVGNHGNNS